MNDLLAGLKKYLNHHTLPGEVYQQSMAPTYRYSKNLVDNPRDCAVMLLMYPIANQWHIVVMRRPVDGTVHSGQISLPGGKREKSDPDIIITAIRECYEETGINVAKERILFSLTPLLVHVSNYHVTPFLGYCEDTPIFNPNPYEVKELISIPIDVFLETNSIKSKKVRWEDKEFVIPYFLYDNNEIWGVTAMILAEFIEIVKRIKQK